MGRGPGPRPFRERATLTGSPLLALASLLGGCAAQPDDSGAGDPAALREEPAQEAFLAWAESLPPDCEIPPMTMQVNLAMAGSLDDLAAADVHVEGAEGAAFSMTMSLAGEFADWTRFRAHLDLQMDLDMLRERSGGRPILMGCALVGDGETVWFEPDWSRSWFLDDVREQGVGIENMVFSVQVATMRELFEALPLALPQDDRERMASVVDCMGNPAELARLTARTSRALAFERRAGRIHAELETVPEAWGLPADDPDNPFAAMFGRPLRYRVQFDPATGAMLRAEYETALGDGNMSMTYLTSLAERPFPPERFVYKLPEGRKAFPLDLFMRPVVLELRRQAGADAGAAAGDFEF